MRSYVTVTTDVDVDIEDVLGCLTTEELKKEIISRGETVPTTASDLVQWLENTTGCKLYSLTDEDICRYVLIGVGRYVK